MSCSVYQARVSTNVSVSVYTDTCNPLVMTAVGGKVRGGGGTIRSLLVEKSLTQKIRSGGTCSAIGFEVNVHYVYPITITCSYIPKSY